MTAALARLCDAHPGQSGVQLLDDGPAALALRIALVRRAQTSIDCQYYIWRDDAAGRLLLLEKVADAPLERRWWLRELDLGACDPEGRCEAPAVPLAGPALGEDDNLEGLACRDDGHCLAVSDDGRLPQPRTLLLWLQLRRGR